MRYAGWLGVGCLALVPALAVAPHQDAGPGDPSAPAAAIRLASEDTSPEAPSPEVRTVTVALTGDVLVHNTVWASADRVAPGPALDFRPMLAPLRPAVSGADLALCHLETPLAPRGGPYQSYPLFAAPPALVPALKWVGYDGCSTASNHSVDQGFPGVARTLDTLDAAGLVHAGTARTARESARVTGFRVNGMDIAWLSYTYGTNGMPVDADKPWSVNLVDVPRVLRDARRARAAGADAVLVALHWGDEYSHAPSAYQRDVAERLTRSEAITLLYGHHAHVVQPIERVNGTWVMFGLGNLLAGQSTTAPGVSDGLIGLVTLRQRGSGPVRVARPTYRPTYIDESDARGEFKVYDVRRALADADTDARTRAELRASLARTRAAIG